MQNKKTKLQFKDGSVYEGASFGAECSVAGEVVFATGMVGYPEAITDPSFAGQILVMTYPLIGNYGVPEKSKWESEKIQITGLIVSTYNETPSHATSKQSLAEWLKSENIPALEIKDTRALTQKLRMEGSKLGKIVFNNKKINFEDPNERNLAAEVSTKEIKTYNPKGKSTIVVIDCGNKENIIKRLVARNMKVVVVPWDTDVMSLDIKFDGVLISNGPGDPKKVTKTIKNVKNIVANKIPTFGICLGNQILTLACGGTTYKMKFGHRSQNQPVVLAGTNSCFLTTQNHGFAVKKIPKDFKVWFTNANDNTNEGIIHNSLPIMSVQFHPEATPGPNDTDWIFDYFFKEMNKFNKKNK